jgi:fatty acid CoA ligase FadD9
METSSRSGINGANDRRERHTDELYANDQKVRDATPLEEITAAIPQPRTPPMRIVTTVMEGYADRLALGERAKELATDPATGLTSLRAKIMKNPDSSDTTSSSAAFAQAPTV